MKDLARDSTPETEGGDGAQRDRLLMENLREVYYIARRIHDRLPPQVALDDLVHAGILGLMDAVRKFDPSKNVQLKHYAKFRIRGAILDSLREGDWSPRALRKQARTLEQVHRTCKARLGREPTELELADEMQMSLEDFQHLLGDLRGLDLGSLQATSAEYGDGEELWQCRPDGDGNNPFYLCLHSEINALLAKVIEELPERERQVLTLYHFEELTMKEVGAVLGIGESRVSQVHTEALLRLRSRLQVEFESRAATAAPQSPAASAKAKTWKTSDPGGYRSVVPSRSGRSGS